MSLSGLCWIFPLVFLSDMAFRHCSSSTDNRLICLQVIPLFKNKMYMLNNLLKDGNNKTGHENQALLSMPCHKKNTQVALVTQFAV